MTSQGKHMNGKTPSSAANISGTITSTTVFTKPETTSSQANQSTTAKRKYNRVVDSAKTKKTKVESKTPQEIIITEIPGGDEAVEFEKMKVLAKQVRGVGLTALLAINTTKVLADLPLPSVLEVYDVETITTPFGETCVLHYHGVDDNGDRTLAKLMCPLRIVEQPTRLQTPACLVYFGKVKKSIGSRDESYHNMVRVSIENATGKLVRERADELRRHSLAKLEKMFATMPLKHYPIGTVFVYNSFKATTCKSDKGESYTTMVVHVSTVGEDGDEVEGDVFVPMRYQKELERCTPGIMISQGEKPVTNGTRTYQSVAFLNGVSIAQLLMKTDRSESGKYDKETKDVMNKTTLKLKSKKMRDDCPPELIEAARNASTPGTSSVTVKPKTKTVMDKIFEDIIRNDDDEDDNDDAGEDDEGGDGEYSTDIDMDSFPQSQAMI